MNTTLRKIGTSFLTLSLVLVAAAPRMSAQAAGKQRIRFARGSTTATVKGVVRGDRGVVYVLGARKGQTLTAKISGSTPNNDVAFSIDTPAGKSLMGAEGDDYGNQWRGELPETGDYRIEIGTIESESSRYTLTVTVEGNPAAANRTPPGPQSGAGSVTGTYSIKDQAELDAQVLPDGRLKFFLFASWNSGRPGDVNVGEASGVVPLEGDTAVYTDENCRITMRFAGRRAHISQEGNCGFGLNVTADGVYVKTSGRAPKFDF
ncbi:MAG: hypothetical protein ACRD68_17265 [Pyrinomonadaceae bacterium]